MGCGAVGVNLFGQDAERQEQDAMELQSST
jgi:hypothetical protein